MKKYVWIWVLCFALLAGCASSQKPAGSDGPGLAGSLPAEPTPTASSVVESTPTEPSSTESAPTEPSGTEPAQTLPPVIGPAIPNFDDPVTQLYLDGADGNQELIFQLADHPGVEYTLNPAGKLFALENGEMKQIFGVYTGIRAMFLADVSGDGVRDLCVTATILNQKARIFVVYDPVEKQHYGLREQNEFDYFARIEDGELVVYRAVSNGRSWINSAEFVPTQEDQRGAVELKDGQLTFTSGETLVYGKCAAPRFDEAVLAEMISQIREKMREEREIDQCMYLQETNFHTELLENLGLSQDSGIQRQDGFLELSFEWIDQNTEIAIYMYVLNHITADSWDYFGLNQWVYVDDSLPGRLIVSTGGQDLGYSQAEEYFAAVAAGACEYHGETFVIHLDKCAVYRYGSEEDIFAKAVK